MKILSSMETPEALSNKWISFLNLHPSPSLECYGNGCILSVINLSLVAISLPKSDYYSHALFTVNHLLTFNKNV